MIFEEKREMLRDLVSLVLPRLHREEDPAAGAAGRSGRRVHDGKPVKENSRGSGGEVASESAYKGRSGDESGGYGDEGEGYGGFVSLADCLTSKFKTQR